MTATAQPESSDVALRKTNVAATEEKRDQIHRNRLLAKARLRPSPIRASERTAQPDARQERNQSESGTPTAHAGVKRARWDGNSAASSSSLKPLPNLIGKYVDYDLSTLKNTKGGFLLDSEEDDPKILKQRQQIQELRKKRLEQAEKINCHPSLSLDPNQNPKCKVCGTAELDFQIFQVFKVPVCYRCKKEHPDRFSLLTKTECKEDYLLTDPELKDTELLPHLLKPNPHQSTYSNMMLYLREQVEEFAFSDRKWGSAEALDEEFLRREAVKKVKKDRKFETRLKQLRKNTRTNVYHRRIQSAHVHQFETKKQDGVEVQCCKTCGLETECETF